MSDMGWTLYMKSEEATAITTCENLLKKHKIEYEDIFDRDCDECPAKQECTTEVTNIMIGGQIGHKIQQEENEQHKKDTAVIRKIKKEIPKKLFKQLNSEIYESWNYKNFRIVDEPVGEEQGDGRNVWVDQYSGYFGDDYHGTVCFKLPDGRFLAWDYWM